MADDENEREQDEMYEDIERRALFDMPQDEDESEIDVVEALRGDESEPAIAGPDADVTLGGYIDVHNRVPAFEGADGQPYTVDVDVEPADDGGAFVAFFVFIRWAATGAGIMDHVESGDIAQGATEDDARKAALDLSLYEVKTELDSAIERKRRQLED